MAKIDENIVNVISEAIMSICAQLGDSPLKRPELEIRLGSFEQGPSGKLRFKSEQSFIQFHNISRKLLTSLPPDSEVSDGTRSLDIRLESSDVRLSINDITDIIRYCKENVIADKHLEVIEKNKSVDQTADIAQYGLRVQLSDEKPVSDELRRNLIDTIQGETSVKYYRYKNRFSYKLSDLFRIDLTAVKTASGKNFRTSNVLNQLEKYEVEIEYIGKFTDKKPNITPDDLYPLVRVMTYAQNGLTITTSDDVSTVTSQYAGLVYPNTPFDKNDNLFIGMDVVAFNHSGFYTIDSEQSPYSVTDKADGERYMLYIADNSQMYLINNRMEIKHTGCSVSTAVMNGSLFDGELVVNRNDPSVNTYLIFDCLYYKGKDIRDLPLYNKETDDIVKRPIFNSPSEPISRYIAMRMFEDFLNAKGLTRLMKDINILFACKKYLFDLPHKSGHIYEYVAQVYNKEKYNYGLDGVIFTPCLDPYPRATLNKPVKFLKLMKWKPIEQLSVDFLIKVSGKTIKTDNNRRYIDAIIYVSRSQDIIPFYPRDKTENFSQIKLYIDDGEVLPRAKDGNVIYDDCVYEFVYDVEQLNWVPLRFRPDKTQLHRPNAYTTASITWGLIREPITLKDVTSGKLKVQTQTYYSFDPTQGAIISGMRDYNNDVKRHIITKYASELRRNNRKREIKLLDIGCGRGGDLDKWSDASINEVFGVDESHPNIVMGKERLYGFHKYFPQRVVYAQGDANKLLHTGDAGQDAIDKEILVSHYKEVQLNYYNLVSCQFAIHYFCKSDDDLVNFIKNICCNITLNGYFIGTALDGRRIFEMLGDRDSITGNKDGTMIWKIDKKYADKEIAPTGQQIDNMIISIGDKPIPEYLFNFDNFVTVAKQYGLELIELVRFNDLRDKIIKRTKSQVMSEDEQKLSDVNICFAFIKKPITGEKPTTSQPRKQLEIARKPKPVEQPVKQPVEPPVKSQDQPSVKQEQPVQQVPPATKPKLSIVRKGPQAPVEKKPQEKQAPTPIEKKQQETQAEEESFEGLGIFTESEIKSPIKSPEKPTPQVQQQEEGIMELGGLFPQSPEKSPVKSPVQQGGDKPLKKVLKLKKLM